MSALVLFISALVTISTSEPVEPYYGAPLAPVVHSLPLQLVHSAPPVFHSLPLQPAAAPFLSQPAPFVSAPVVVSQPQPLVTAPLAVAGPAPSNQFHAQDEFGQFTFGYENQNSAKFESKDAFGVTRGSYQYVDANGLLQTVNYISDDINGFRVAGTNIPVAPSAAVLPVGPEAPVAAPLVPVAETPEVAAARAEHLAAVEAAKAAVSTERKRREAEPIQGDYETPLAPVIVHSVPLLHSLPSPVVHSSPLLHTVPAPISPVFHSATAPISHVFHATAPIAPALPVPLVNHFPAPVSVNTVPLPPVIAPAPSNQFHAQDEFGQFTFGYENQNSAKFESKDAFGVTRGSYQYVDANGLLQTVNYISDDINGFRVAGTNIPVAPSAAVLPVGPEAPVAAPLVPVVETPEVAAARAEHLAAVEAAKAAVAE